MDREHEQETAGHPTLGVDAATQRDRDRMRLAVVLLLAALGAYAILRLLAPFTLAIVTASVAAVLSYSVFERARRRIGHDGIAAGLVTTGVFVLVVVPLAGILVVLTGGIESSVRLVADRVEDFTEQQGQVWSLVESTASLLGIEVQEVSATVEDQLSRLGSVLAGGTVGVLSGLGTWVAQAGIGLFTLFYLLRDGELFLDVLRWIVPLEPALTDALFAKTKEVVTATVLGTLLVGAAQGIAGGVLFWALDIPGAALWGAVMAFLGLLPVVGPPVVWIPAALLLLSAGRITDALILAAVGGLVISTLDNVLRAILVGERAELHSLVVFFSVLGGVIVFGAAGFLFGPVLVVVAFSMLEIARVALAGDDPDRLADNAAILSRITTSADGMLSAEPEGAAD